MIGEHFAEYPPYGIAFTALAWFQVGWAVGWVIERRRPIALAAIAINGGALAVWAISRTAHGGVGSYRLRYLRGDELLAEGTFELVP